MFHDGDGDGRRERVDGLQGMAVKQLCVSDIFPETLPQNMKTNLASRRSTSPHLAALALLCPSLLALSSSSSQGAAASPDPSTFTTATCSYVNGVKRWVYRVDPPEVQAFRFTVTFDASRARFNTAAGVLFKQPFTGVVDSSQGAAGILLISGSTPVGQVTPGDVDLFEIVFDDLSPLLPINNVTFTVGGAAGDFIQAYDPSNPVPPLPQYTGAATGPVSRSVTPGILPFVWDPDGGYNNGTTGGAGTWNTGGTSFDSLPQPEILTGLTPGDTTWTNGTNLAVFGGNPGTGLVNVSAGISAGGLQFDMPGYQLSGGSITLDTPAGAVPTIEVRAGAVTVLTPLSGTKGFTKTGAGTIVLGGTSNYTGVTTIQSGTVSVAALANGGVASPLGASTSAASNLVFDGGTLQFTGANANTNRGFTINPGKTAVIDVLNAASSLTIAGAGTGAGALTKIGAGALTLAGANTFTGGTTVLAGTLINLGSLASGVTVLSGARLSGSGSIGGALTIGPGGDLRPSATGLPTTMNLGSVTMNSGAFFELTLNSNTVLADKLVVASGTDLGTGGAQLSVVDSGSTPLALGTALTIIDNGSGSTSGFFTGLSENSSFSAGANTFRINYNAGAGSNDVLLTVVPEPSSALLLTAALALGGARRRRSREG